MSSSSIRPAEKPSTGFLLSSAIKKTLLNRASSKPSSQSATVKVILMHLNLERRSHCMCGTCAGDDKQIHHMDFNPCLTLTNPLFDHIFVNTEMCFTAAALHVWTAKITGFNLNHVPVAYWELWLRVDAIPDKTSYLLSHLRLHRL